MWVHTYRGIWYVHTYDLNKYTYINKKKMKSQQSVNKLF